jgi:large subunit ribosomal protein L20
MARVKRGVQVRARHNKILDMAKGYRGRNATCYRMALERVEKGLQYAYRDRRNKKRDMRKLWIIRINAGARAHGMTYSALINGLGLAGIEIDRKVLAELAIHQPADFGQLVEQAKQAAA